MSLLEDRYQQACATPSDIYEHLPTLRALATGCQRVVEMGVRHGVSTLALLAAQPDVIDCYDMLRFPEWEGITAMRGRTNITFHIADSREVVLLEEPDFLFIDTFHIYDQLKVELERHAPRVKKKIALHDTVTFGARGEDPAFDGLWKAVEELVATGTFKIVAHHTNNNGLTVLERV